MRFRNTIYTLLLLLTACSSEKPSYLEPHLTTLAATDITRTEATLHGTAVVEGETDMPQLCFIYGTTPQMELTTPPATAQGSSVTMPLSQLKAGTTYYYMLQGNNGRTTTDSNTMTFDTDPMDKPTLGEAAILSYGPISVIVEYEIKEDGGEPITETGCYYAMGEGEKQQATASGSQQPGTSLGAQKSKLKISNLERNATYQIWPYAKNRVGETIGNAISFTTSDAIMLGEAGALLSLMGTHLYEYSDISLAGTMNGDDLACLRKMMGRDADGSATPGQLAVINMSDAKIAAGGGSYGASRYTEDDVIGQELFAHCAHLSSIILPSSATILEKDAFLNCPSLRTIEIPAAISTLLPSSGCTALEAIAVSKANTHYQSQDGVLFNADATQILWFPLGKKGSYTLPSTITSIGDYAFRDCSIETFIFPDALQEIGLGAFKNSKVREVRLPNNLRMLGTGCFQGCAQLQVVRLGSKTEKVCEYAFESCPLTDLYVGSEYPPTCEENAFATNSSKSLYASCTIHVPAGKKKLYQNHPTWGKFATIVEQ